MMGRPKKLLDTDRWMIARLRDEGQLGGLPIFNPLASPEPGRILVDTGRYFWLYGIPSRMCCYCDYPPQSQREAPAEKPFMELTWDKRQRDKDRANRRNSKNLIELVIAVRLREYKEAGCLSAMLSGHSDERRLWRIWAKYKNFAFIYGEINEKHYNPLLDKINLPKIEK